MQFSFVLLICTLGKVAFRVGLSAVSDFRDIGLISNGCYKPNCLFNIILTLECFVSVFSVYYMSQVLNCVHGPPHNCCHWYCWELQMRLMRHNCSCAVGVTDPKTLALHKNLHPDHFSKPCLLCFMYSCWCW